VPWGAALGVLTTIICSSWALWAFVAIQGHNAGARSVWPFVVPLWAGWLASRDPQRRWPMWVWSVSAGAAVTVAASVLLPVQQWGVA